MRRDTLALRSHSLTLKRRAEFGFCFFALCFAVVAARLIDVQVYQHAALKARADRYHIRDMHIEPARGLLRDRNGSLLAQNLPLKSVYADPKMIDDPAAVAAQLASVLGEKPETLEARLRRPGSFAWLKRKVDKSTEAAVRKLNIKGVDFAPETKRVYPQKTLAANVIGFANIDGKGIEGLERSLDPTLAGKPGEVVAEVDAYGRVIPGTEQRRVDVVDGYSVTLTLDTAIQHIAEQAVETTFAKYQAAGVCAIVMDPRTGEILAMATRPTFDPNQPAADATPNESPERKMARRRNRCVTDVYEPGSTMKSITAAAALQAGAITPSSTFYCGGSFMVGKRRIRCVLHGAEYAHGHGAQTIKGILRESCNVGAAQIGLRLGGQKLYRAIADFGFLGDTRVGLSGEQPGLLDPPSNWVPVKLANVAFGQGVAVTPLQVVTAYSAIANGGKLMQPYMIRRVEDANGTLVQEYAPHVVRQVVSAETAREVTCCLKGVVEEGTGKPAQVKGYSVAGKTGSAQKVVGGHGYAAGHFVGSFVGFAPADNPRIACIVMVDEPQGSHWGATTAAPAFQQIIAGALWSLKVPPDRPQDLPQVAVGR